MSGALTRSRSRKFRYAEGGEVDNEEPDQGSYSSDAGPGAGAAYTAAPGAFNQGQAQSGDDAEEQFAGLARGVLPPDVPGAFNVAQTARDAATQRQLELIRAARARIPTASGIDPGLAMAAALLAPTKTGTTAEGWSSALNAYGGARERAQQDALKRAEDLGEYDVLEGKVGTEGAGADYDILKERISLGERAAQARATIAQRAEAAAERAQVAKEAAAERAQRDAEAQQYHQDLIDQRRDAAELNRYTWQAGEGADPNDPTATKKVPGMYRLPSKPGEEPIFYPGKTLTGRAGGGTSVYERRVQDLMSATGLSRDQVVLRMTQKGLTAEKYDSDIAAEKAQLRQFGKPNNTGQYQGWTSEDELSRAAEANVAKRVATALKATGTPPPLTRSAPQLYNSPYPARAAPSSVMPGRAASATTAPAPTLMNPNVVPARPSGVPPGARYSPSQKKWWWQQDGKWMSGG